MPQPPWRKRSTAYRRRGPDRKGPYGRWIGRAQHKHLHLRRQLVGWRWAHAGTAAFVPVAVALYAARKRAGLPMAVTLPIVSVTPIAVAAVVPPGRWRYIAAGAAYMWVFKATWELPADNPEKLRERLRVDYPIQIDTLLGGGIPPTLRLQRALRDPPRVTVIDRVVTVIYGSWFVPHLVLAWVWLHHESYLPRAAGRLAASYQLTTPFYWLLPTAPPWWASECGGRMGGEVERVLRHVIRDVRGRPRETVDTTPGNPWGSMPSDHISSAAITAMGLSEVGTVYGVAGWTYVALAAFAVVYLGEHYLVDVIAGLVVAETVRLGEPVINPVVRLVARNLERVGA